jgi:cytochrome c553
MHEEASHLSNDDLEQAAAYFSSLRFSPWTKVVETATVPKMHVESSMWVPTKGAGREPIGERIIVTPLNLQLTQMGDTRSGYIAYAPTGSIERGAVIASKGVGTAPACESCHGADLHGVGDIPPLAGRMPNYIVHELILFRLDKRANAQAAPMRMEASHLTLKEMIDVAAYTASRKP